ncbi:MAG: hypothetical protein IT164_09845 [Bryobacterales bacterium]|nr:hypothetical protein [Bryobacterales bacterium]
MKMRVPVLVWLRPSKAARAGKLMLDLCTTPNGFSDEGREAVRLMLARLCPNGRGRVEAVGAEWQPVSALQVAATAGELFRMASTIGVYQPDLRRLEARLREMARQLKLPVPIRRRKAIA